LDKSCKNTAPIACGKCPNLIAPAPLRSNAVAITSIVRVDFTARLAMGIIGLFAEKLIELPF
jgi:hypothetical protein